VEFSPWPRMTTVRWRTSASAVTFPTLPSSDDPLPSVLLHDLHEQNLRQFPETQRPPSVHVCVTELSHQRVTATCHLNHRPHHHTCTRVPTVTSHIRTKPCISSTKDFTRIRTHGDAMDADISAPICTISTVICSVSLTNSNQENTPKYFFSSFILKYFSLCIPPILRLRSLPRLR